MYFSFAQFLHSSALFIIIYIFLIGNIITDSHIKKASKRDFMFAIFLCSLHLLVDYIGSISSEHKELITIRTIASLIGYSIRPFIILVFIKLTTPNAKHITWLVLNVINLLMYATTPYTHLCVYFTENNVFKRGPLGMLIFILCACELIYIPLYSIITSYKNNTRHWILPSICTIIIFIAVYNDYAYRDVSYPNNLNLALPLVMFLFYYYYQLLLIEQQGAILLQNQQLQLMVSQIKPHFFFNTITTIQALCHIDPKKASDTLGTFANYVRQNLNTQTQPIIPFDQELQHVKAYVDIEVLRFTNLDIQYDLEVTDFDITSFSIQPLIENAIKHGVRTREHGIITLRTSSSSDTITITVEDNGIGFDVSSLASLDSTHIGINNVRSRLKILQDASMEITSADNGTIVTIKIPWES